MHIITTNTPKIYYKEPDVSSQTEATIPGEVEQATPFTRPAFALYNKRTYIAGQFRPNLVFTEFQTLSSIGIKKPTSALTASVGTSTGITATSIRYKLAYVEKNGSVLIAESDQGPASTAITAVSNKSINLTNIPATAPSSRTTHVRIYRSDNGGLYRITADVLLGTTSFTDARPTLSLGAIAPKNHGIPPYSKYVEAYHDRVWYAGDPSQPQRLYYSELYKGEAVGALNYIDTRDGEAINGIKRVGNELLLGCQGAFYSITGYSEADFVMKKISPSIGCISHYSMVNIDETLWFASDKGVYMYNGSFVYMMEDLQNYWRVAIEANGDNYRNCVGIDDRYYQGYLLLIPSSATFCYFGYYPPAFEGQQPDWYWDTRTRQDTAIGVLGDANHNFQQFAGGADSSLRLINDETDDNDDSDPAGKVITIQTGAQLFGDPGGNKQEGKSFQELWTYVYSEAQAWTLYALGGDEDCVNAGTPNNTTHFWKDSVAASASAGKTAQSVHYHQPVKVSGRALSLKITATNPTDFRYRGFGGIYGNGDASRPAT